jgi:preprotein translocase subunit SecE
VKKIFNYLSEVRGEMAKVIWPSRADTIKLTLTVFIFSAVVGVYVSGLDYLFTSLIGYIITH